MAERINMIAQFHEALEDKNSKSKEEFEIECKNLLSHAFVELENEFKSFCKSQGKEYGDEIFYAYQDIIVYIMLSDGDFLQGEYDAYLRFCDWANFQPLTVANVRSLFDRLDNDRVATDMRLLASVRDDMDAHKYAAMTLGFCCLAIMGDKEIDENEYYIIRCLYDPSVDNVPSTWEAFKAQF